MLQKLIKMSSKAFNLALKYKKLSIFRLFWAAKTSNLLLENIQNLPLLFFYHMKQLIFLKVILKAVLPQKPLT